MKSLLNQRGSLLIETCLWMFLCFLVVLLFSKLSAKSYVGLSEAVTLQHQTLRR